jgi:hypothetical protein
MPGRDRYLDGLLEVFDGSHLVIYRFTIQPTISALRD